MSEIKRRKSPKPNLIDVHFTESVLTRLKLAFRVEDDKELAEIIEITPSAISACRKRGGLPLRKLIAKIVETEGEVSLDWIFGNSKSNVARP